MDLRTRVFVRVTGLAALFVAVICVAYIGFLTWQHRDKSTGTFRAEGRELAERLNRMLLDDYSPAAILSHLEKTRLSNRAVEYVFLERDAAPYLVSSYRSASKVLSPEILGRRNLNASHADILTTQDADGETVYDFALLVPQTDMVLHIGVNRSMMDMELRPVITIVLICGLCFVLASAVVAAFFAWWTTREVHQLTRELEGSEDKYRRLVESAREGVIVVLDDRICLANRAAAQMLGYSQVELVGHSFSALVHPEDREKVRARYEFDTTEESTVTRCAYRVIGRDGGEHWVESGALPIEWEGTTAVLELLNDVTQSRRAEEERVRLETAIGQTAEAVSITDPDWNLQYVNPAFELISGLLHDEIIGQKEPVHTENKKDSAEFNAMMDLLREGEPWRGHTKGTRADGQPYEAEVTVSPVRDNAGRLSNYVIVKRDVTEEAALRAHEVELQAQLRQLQKMEALGTLAGGIAHDFNNILQVMLGYTEMARNRIAPDHRAIQSLEKILTAGQRASELVNQILTFSRQTEQECRPLALQPIIKECLKLLRGTLPTTIHIKQRIDEECGPVLTDPVQIHQVLMNLCTNAYHAMRDGGGRLEVRLRQIRVGDEHIPGVPDIAPGTYARLTVGDTGAGMDKTTRDRIFEPYFTTKKPGEGTGLGLAMVHGIVRAAHGIIGVHSRPDEGTTFHIFFPVYDMAMKEETVTEPPIDVEGDERILFVDDEQEIAELAKMGLEPFGYSVTTCTSGIEAIALFIRDPNQFDVVVTDQTMPNITGIELARRILEERPTIPIILISGFSEVAGEQQAQAVGIRRYVRKPVVPRDLATAIRQVLNLNRSPVPMTTAAETRDNAPEADA